MKKAKANKNPDVKAKAQCVMEKSKIFDAMKTIVIIYVSIILGLLMMVPFFIKKVIQVFKKPTEDTNLDQTNLLSQQIAPKLDFLTV